jgi:hypothetical protein
VEQFVKLLKIKIKIKNNIKQIIKSKTLHKVISTVAVISKDNIPPA